MTPATSTPGSSGAGGLAFPAALAVAAGTGFVALAFEIIWVRALAFTNGSRPWTFGALLGAYLLGVALAARECEKLGLRSPVPGPLHRAALAFSVLGASALAYLVVPLLAALAPLRAWPSALALLAVAAGALGAALPLTAHLAIPADDRAGARLSYLYLADIAGCTLGGTATGYLLLDRVPLATANLLLGLAGLGIGALLLATASLAPRARAVGAAVAVGAAAGMAWGGPTLHDRLWERLLRRGPASGVVPFAEVLENRHGVIAVTRDGVVLSGGVYDGAFSTDLIDDRNAIVRAYALAGLHPAPRRVLFIGLGSGSWAQVLANLPGVEALTVVEINPGYVELVRRHAEVSSVLTNPKVEIVIDDARRWLQRHPERSFDAIVSNSSFHWREHATNLLSVEFARLAQRRLAPGGLFYFNTTSAPECHDTALAVFANGLAIGSFFAASDAPLVFDPARLRAALAQMRIDGRPVLDQARTAGGDLVDRRFPGRLLPEARRANPRVITDDNMLTEWLDARFAR